MAQELADPGAPAQGAIADVPATVGIVESIKSLSPGRIVALGAVTVLLLSFFAYIIFRATTPSYGILFSGLSIDDAQIVTQRLETMGVNYRLTPDGDAIMVPNGDVLRLRMSMASEGLPAGGSVGYELFDESSSLTATDFVSNVNLRRALEGELARTIMSLRQVRSARVHIVSPSRQPFSRNESKPTASVVVGVSTLDDDQLAGIRHLVASAVPGMSAHDVSIIDDRGNLLASPEDDSVVSASIRHEEQRATLEDRLRNKIIALIERSVGRGRVEAQIFAEIDFDNLTTTTEEFDPEGQVARSVQTIEEANERQENENDGAVTVQNNLPAEGGAQQGGPSAAESASRAEESTNFEISRTVRSQSRVGGVIERLSVAVQVDFREVIDDAGNVTYEPRDEQDLEQIEALVRSAVGLDEERGDRIEVVSRRFAPDDIPELEEPSMFEFSRADYWRAAELAILAILGFAGVALGVRPLLRYGFGIGKKDDNRDNQSIDGLLDANGNPIPLIEDNTGEAMSMEDENDDILDDLVNMSGVDGKVKASLIDKVTEIIAQNPDAGVRVLRSWLHGG